MALPANPERLEASMRGVPARLAEIAVPETIRYARRPGLPDGAGVAIGFAIPQLLLCAAFLWAVWYPLPVNSAMLVFDIVLSLLLTAAGAGTIWLLLRDRLPLVAGVLRAPFTRLTVTDRRVLWTVPWSRAPILEIECARVLGGVLGDADERGRGHAAIILMPGDPAGDDDARIHIDGLPDVAGFIEALRRLA